MASNDSLAAHGPISLSILDISGDCLLSVPSVQDYTDAVFDVGENEEPWPHLMHPNKSGQRRFTVRDFLRREQKQLGGKSRATAAFLSLINIGGGGEVLDWRADFVAAIVALLEQDSVSDPRVLLTAVARRPPVVEIVEPADAGDYTDPSIYDLCLENSLGDDVPRIIVGGADPIEFEGDDPLDAYTNLVYMMGRGDEELLFWAQRTAPHYTDSQGETLTSNRLEARCTYLNSNAELRGALWLAEDYAYVLAAHLIQNGDKALRANIRACRGRGADGRRPANILSAAVFEEKIAFDRVAADERNPVIIDVLLEALRGADKPCAEAHARALVPVIDDELQRVYDRSGRDDGFPTEGGGTMRHGLWYGIACECPDKPDQCDCPELVYCGPFPTTRREFFQDMPGPVQKAAGFQWHAAVKERSKSLLQFLEEHGVDLDAPIVERFKSGGVKYP